MKQLRTLALGAVLLLALAGCASIARNAIGAQPAPDALHLDGQRVKVINRPPFGGLSVQAERTQFTATEEIRFPDIDWADIQSKAPINVPIPRSYRETLGITGINGAGIVLASPDAPDELVLEGITLDLAFSNANGLPNDLNFSMGMASLPAPLQPRLVLTETDVDGNGHYEVDPDFAEAMLSLIEINLDGPKFARLFNEVLKDNGKPQDNPADYNRMQVEVNVWLSSPEGDGTLAGSEFTFEFATHDGTLDWKK